MPQNMTSAILRVYYIAHYGEDISKDDLSHAVRATRPNESTQSQGGQSALDILLKGEVIETHYYGEPQDKVIALFLEEVVEDVPELLSDAKEYLKLLADAASLAGLLPN